MIIEDRSELEQAKKNNSNKLIEWKKDEYEKIDSDIPLILKEQKINQRDSWLGFIGLAVSNNELIDINKKQNQKLEIVVKELDVLKKERREKVILKQARANRIRLPKRQPMKPEIYCLLIRAAESTNYTSIRLRVAFCLLTVTGIRMNELLSLKVYQLKRLLKYDWVGVDRSKNGPAHHKAFLTCEGKRLIDNRKKDFELLLLMKNEYSYIFTSESNHNKMLSRETITKNVNKIMRLVSKNLPENPNITSHSFRIGYISELWKNTKYIEFVNQSVGHRRLDSTSSYT
jgi:site-specific recombinase XerD